MSVAATPRDSATVTTGGVWTRIAGVTVGLSAAVCLMLLAFLAPAIHSGPHDLPLAVGGPAQAVTPLTQALEQRSPGAFDVTTYAGADEVRQAVRDRDAIGGISLGTGGVTVTTAGGAGTPYGPLLKGIGAGLQSSGQKVTYEDVAPLTADDPTGIGIGVLALPFAFGGMIQAVLLSTLVKGRPRMRIAGALVVSVVAGFAVAAVLQFGFGSVDGNYWETAGALALGIAAISLVVLGLESLLGFPGLGIGGLLMIFLANPLSGLATGPAWLPSPWGAIGQLMPIGAAGTLIRSVAFFDGRGAGHAVVVLCVWVVVGILLAALGMAKTRRPARGRHEAGRDAA